MLMGNIVQHMTQASPRLLLRPSVLPLVDEIDAEEMQYHRAEDEVGECSKGRATKRQYTSSKSDPLPRQRYEEEHNIPLCRNPLEILLVLRVRLDAQAGREHELAHRRAEAGQEGVEGLSIIQSVSAASSPFPIVDGVRKSSLSVIKRT